MVPGVMVKLVVERSGSKVLTSSVETSSPKSFLTGPGMGGRWP